MTHTDLLDYVAKNSPVKITTNDGQEFIIANRESIVADAGCSMIAIASARSMANGTELAKR